MSVQTRRSPQHSGAEPGGAAADDKPIDPGRAWAPYEPDARRPWDLRLAGHLYRRAAFGATWEQLKQGLADGPQRTVDGLLRPKADCDALNRTYDEYEASAGDSGSAQSLRAWWLRRMMSTPHPLLEKMTLFWHDHFAVTGARVKSARLMREHVQLLRRYALGRFDSLLQAVARDPAVLVCLDAAANRRARPSEHFARTLLDRFSLGPGSFAESDVREAARAFTGWFVLRGRLRYIAREHDSGVKRVLGREGNFDGQDVVRILVNQPSTPRLLVRKLYRWLISETDEPGDALIAPLTESFAKDYDVARLVETMLRSNLFFSPTAYRRRIKSPVEFALGIVKGLEGIVSTTHLGNDLAALGQDLYHPPTAKGWQGGHYWINRATLIGRSNLARALVAGGEPYGERLDPSAVAKRHGHTTAESAGRFLLDVFLQSDVEAEVREALLKSSPPAAASAGGDSSRWLRRFTHGVVTLPEFHLA